ncbi:hypothetical protein M406DRAFT_326378 [Cryphonectria parasitica EP155]|uniref:Uncharacterized protein n=1 Tax=Cryphonectria parasitica (strain ATCC 38755 / EP155) TaxID=660469 RepID=A0A9P4YCS1_CRYP1|nr:uncharacterized protein M406DRAFT_326378 [Cryphonectria parasitica EP155]KAF3770968.1 hypothetical protein M406DRAFT_326378 [Cryphonectria parasitica EP155]
MYSSSLIHSPSRAHSASSLRDQIRSLRSELSARNEDCAQLRLELEEIRNMKAVNEAILRDGLNRARKETATWSRRAERAERKIDDFECRAMHTENHRRDEQIEAGDGYSFDSGSDHIDVSQAQARSVGARMNQGIRRAKSNTFAGVDGANCADDEFSECSSSTVVRNTSSAGEDDGATGSGLWSAEDEDVSFPSPGLMDEYL